MYFLEHIWMIPLFPLAGAILMLLIGKKLSNSLVSLICPGVVGISFLYALGNDAAGMIIVSAACRARGASP